VNNEQQHKWISEGRQLGIRFSFIRNGNLYWSSIGIQKWGGLLKVYVDEILESEMDAENYSREELLEFSNVDNALKFISENTIVNIENLKPCKGQKIFNPEFR